MKTMESHWNTTHVTIQIDDPILALKDDGNVPQNQQFGINLSVMVWRNQFTRNLLLFVNVTENPRTGSSSLSIPFALRQRENWKSSIKVLMHATQLCIFTAAA